MASLVITLPSGSEETHELSGDTVTVGRLPENDIQIEDASVSSHHAEFVLAGGEYRLKDLGSTNGTRVLGERIEEIELEAGTAIRFGSVDTVFSPAAPGDTQPLPELETTAATPAAESHRPNDFANASPFKSKGKIKDGAGSGIMGFAIFSLIVFLGAVATILMLQPPQ